MPKGIVSRERGKTQLIELHAHGCRIKTEYDKPEDPPSIDATMLITIHDPLKEPMIHKDFPGGPEDLQEYTMEVCEGIKDHLVRRADDPEDTRWEYTYHSVCSGTTDREAGCFRPDQHHRAEARSDALYEARPGDHLEGLGRQ